MTIESITLEDRQLMAVGMEPITDVQRAAFLTSVDLRAEVNRLEQAITDIHMRYNEATRVAMRAVDLTGVLASTDFGLDGVRAALDAKSLWGYAEAAYLENPKLKVDRLLLLLSVAHPDLPSRDEACAFLATLTPELYRDLVAAAMVKALDRFAFSGSESARRHSPEYDARIAEFRADPGRRLQAEEHLEYRFIARRSAGSVSAIPRVFGVPLSRAKEYIDFTNGTDKLESDRYRLGGGVADAIRFVCVNGGPHTRKALAFARTETTVARLFSSECFRLSDELRLGGLQNRPHHPREEPTGVDGLVL